MQTTRLHARGDLALRPRRPAHARPDPHSVIAPADELGPTNDVAGWPSAYAVAMTATGARRSDAGAGSSLSGVLAELMIALRSLHGAAPG
jgi:hypothetical protein